MLAMAVPFVLLFEVSLILARFIKASGKKKEAAEVIDDDLEGEEAG